MTPSSQLLERLNRLARMGWVREPAPVTPLPAHAKRLGLSFLGIKRDDLLEPLHGGTKVRKLDCLLATAPFAEAPVWASAGAIGSGHLVALTAAARELGRRLEACCFWEPVSAGVLDNLAFTASGPTTLHYHRSRVELGLRRSGMLLGKPLGGVPAIPPGGTTPAALVGLVHAGLELAEQIRRGELPAPERVYVALGSGGTAAGLSVGLGLGGVRATLHAVAVVERVFTLRRRLRALQASLLRWLEEHGVEGARAIQPAELVIDRSQLGPGYGVPTAQSLAACELIRDVGLEPIYTGKAMAALLADAARAGSRPANVLFWHTARRGPLPREPDWQARLPEALARRLAEVTRPRRLSRRLVLAGAGAGAALVAWGRLSGYPLVPGWAGQVLSLREALVLAAATEALLPQGPGAPTPLTVASNVDRFLAGMPEGMVREIHLLLGVLIEHGTTPLGLWLSRFTALSPAAREAFLAGLGARGGLLAQAYGGLRDLCMLGYYQEPTTWEALGYGGPWGPAGVQVTPYETFRAPLGTLPRGMVGRS